MRRFAAFACYGFCTPDRSYNYSTTTQGLDTPSRRFAGRARIGFGFAPLPSFLRARDSLPLRFGRMPACSARTTALTTIYNTPTPVGFCLDCDANDSVIYRTAVCTHRPSYLTNLDALQQLDYNARPHSAQTQLYGCAMPTAKRTTPTEHIPVRHSRIYLIRSPTPCLAGLPPLRGRVYATDGTLANAGSSRNGALNCFAAPRRGCWRCTSSPLPYGHYQLQLLIPQVIDWLPTA